MNVLRKTIMIGLILFLFIITGCDPWSTYPSTDKHGGNPYDGALVWEEVSDSSPWVARYRHTSVVFEDKLWILGGYGYQGITKDSYLEDVWSSVDGVSWELETMDAPWHGRTGHSVVVLNNKLFLIGGYAVDEDGESTHNTNHYMNDVWESSDGETWTQVTESTPFGDRAYHEAVVVDVDGTDTIYVIGGRNKGVDYYDDIWKSTDGENWTQVLLPDDKDRLGKRAAMAVSVVGTKVYIEGGYTPDYEIAQVD